MFEQPDFAATTEDSILSGFIYAASVGKEYIKFGATRNIKRRLTELRCAYGKQGLGKVDLIASIKLPKSRPFPMEWIVHRALGSYRADGELFIRSPKTLAACELMKTKCPEQLLEIFSGWAMEAIKRTEKSGISSPFGLKSYLGMPPGLAPR